MAENSNEMIFESDLSKQIPESQIITLDVIGPEEILDNRRIPDTLPKGSFQELPETFNMMIQRLDDNPILLSKINNLLRELIIRLGKEAGNMEEIFTEAVPIPKNIDKELMKLLGVTSDQLRKAGDTIGFSFQNRMLTEPYYIILSFLYYYGTLDKDGANKNSQDFLRHASLILILVRIYRGRISRFFKQGADATTVKYVMEKKLKKNNIAVVCPNTFEAIYKIWTPRLDTKYKDTINAHPAHDRRGMVSLMKAARTRLHQAYFGLAKHYYDAFYAGIKTGNYQNDEFAETQKLTIIQKVVDKIYTNITYMNNPVSEEDKQHIRNDLKLSIETVHKFEAFIKNHTNGDETRRVLELILLLINISSESDLANLKVVETAEKIAASRSRENSQELKDLIDQIIKLIFGKDILNASPSQQLKIRKAFILLFILKIKQPFKKQQSYFEKKIQLGQ